MRFSIDFLYKVNKKILYIRENFVKRHKLHFTTGAKCDIIKMLGQTGMFACFCRKREVWLVKDRKPVYTEEYASYFPYAEFRGRERRQAQACRIYSAWALRC